MRVLPLVAAAALVSMVAARAERTVIGVLGWGYH
jgi:hypothetical protein